MATSELVLLFHGIGDPPPAVSAAERPYWIGHAAFAAVVQHAAEVAAASDVTLMVTFDDGNRSDLDIAGPLLRTFGIPGMFFPCAGRLKQPGYLGVMELRELHAMGFEIGTHGMDHMAWSSLGVDGLAREVDIARDILAQALGHPIQRAALPFGAYDRRVLRHLRRSSFAAVHSSDPGMNPRDAWLARRWCYVQGRPFDVAEAVRLSRSRRFQLHTGLKRLAKSLR